MEVFSFPFLFQSKLEAIFFLKLFFLFTSPGEVAFLVENHCPGRLLKTLLCHFFVMQLFWFNAPAIANFAVTAPSVVSIAQKGAVALTLGTTDLKVDLMQLLIVLI